MVLLQACVSTAPDRNAAVPPAPPPAPAPEASTASPSDAPAPDPAAPRRAPVIAPSPSPADTTSADNIELTAPAEARQVVKIGLLLPLSGPQAAIGRAFFNAAQLALFDFNDPGIELVTRDSEGTAEGAKRAAEDALAGGARMLLGPLFSHEVAAATPIARAGGVNLIAFSTDRTVAGPGTYLMGYLPEEQIARVTAYALYKGHARFAVLAPESPYGRRAIGAFQQAVQAGGGSLVHVSQYQGGGEDTHATVKRLARYDVRRRALADERRRLAEKGDAESKLALKRLETRETLGEVDFDAILVPDGGAGLRAVAPLLPYYEIDPAEVQFLGTGLWDDPTLGLEPALIGGWFAGPAANTMAAFESRYAAAFGAKPPRVASIAYDAVALAEVLAAEEGGPDFSTEALTDARGFTGMGGIFRLRPDGLAERGLAIYEVRREGSRVLVPAPATFQDLGF